MATLTDDEYVAIARRAYEALRKYPNVFAVGVGGRERGGRPTGEIVLKVFVSAKKDRTNLADAELLPAEFEGVPTDIVEASPPGHEQLALVPGFRFTDTFNYDTDRYRPLKGGGQVEASFRLGTGTLGFLATVAGSTNVMAITNYHVLYDYPSAPPSTSVTVGNPDPDESCTKCCVNRFGTYAAGYFDSILDLALIKLDPGIQWVAEIQGIGGVRGRHDATVAEAATLTYNVRKYGATTRLTGGTLQSIGTTVSAPGTTLGARTCSNAIVVKPNPRSDGSKVRFSGSGDSGSAYVNDANEIIGVHFGGMKSQTDPKAGWGWGTGIKPIIDTFTSRNAITLAVATATAADQVQTVPGAAAALPAATGEAEALAQRLQAELSTSEAGRLMTVLWMRHSSELNRLVNGNRKVATLWHRNAGPALFQHAIRAAKLPAHVIPEALDGQPVEQRMATILDVFARYGSERLRADILAHRSVLPPVGGRTYADILSHLHNG